MKNINKINKSEMGALTFFLVRAFYIGITLNNLIKISKQDSYISMIIAFLIGFIPFILIYYIFNYEPNLSLLQKNLKLFGNILGTIINIILIWFTFFITLIIFSNLVTFIFSQYLNKTPTLIISIVFIFAIVYVLIHDIKTICRTAMILFFFTTFLFLLSLIGLSTQISIDNFKPFLESSYISLFKGSYSFITYNILPLYLLLIIPKNDIDNKHFFKHITLGYIFASISLFFVLLTTIGIFGIKLCQLYEYPEFQVLKYVSLIGISARIDGILIIQWIFDFLIFIIIGMYFILETTKTMFKVNKHIYSILLAIILVLLNEYITNNMLLNNLSITLFPHIIFIFISSLLLIMFITIKLKKLFK